MLVRHFYKLLILLGLIDLALGIFFQVSFSNSYILFSGILAALLVVLAESGALVNLGDRGLIQTRLANRYFWVFNLGLLLVLAALQTPLWLGFSLVFALGMLYSRVGYQLPLLLSVVALTLALGGSISAVESFEVAASMGYVMLGTSLLSILFDKLRAKYKLPF